jgi:polyisoprenoid-binding protein YceI
MPSPADRATKVPQMAKGQFDASHGQLQLGTGVTGRGAKMGHRLTIAMERWQAQLSWSGQRPTAAALTVEVDSLQVLRGDGGLTPLTAPEKSLIRSNARNCLDAAEYSRIRFECSDIAPTDDGYRLAGSLEIRGRTRPHVIKVRVTRLDGPWRIEGETVVRHTDFGIRRYSMLMGALRVADEVTVHLCATVPEEKIRGS